MLRHCLLLLVLSALAGCNAHVFSPPTGSFPIESSATVGQGKHAARGDLASAGAIFGPSLFSARGSYSYGVRDRLELSAAPSLIVVQDSRPSDSSPNIYTLRLGFKYAPVKHVALIAGSGAGHSAAGAFISDDLGLIGAFENRYLVPFASARGLFSLPIAARRVHFSTDDDASSNRDDDLDEEPDEFRLKPTFTYGFQLSTGVRLPLTYEKDPAVRPSFVCALGLTALYDGRKYGRETYGGLSCGVEVVF